MNEEIIVHIKSLDFVYHEQISGMGRELDMKVSLKLPDNLQLKGSGDMVANLERMIQYCLNKGIETYEADEQQKKLTGQLNALNGW